MAHRVGRFSYEDTFYECLHSVDAGPFVISERRFPPKFRERSHVHGLPYIHGILHGSLTESGLHQTEGSVGIVPAAEHTSVIHEAGLHILVVELHLPDVSIDEPRTDTSPELRFNLAKLFRELQRPDPFTPLALAGAAYELLASACRQAPRPVSGVPGWLTGIVDRIQDSPGDTFTVEGLAAEAYVHPATLSRAFRRNLGCTVADFVRQNRLEESRDLLARTDESVASIAARTGFVDQSHLGRWFRRRYGVSPAEYRSIHTRTARRILC